MKIKYTQDIYYNDLKEIYNSKKKIVGQESNLS